MFQCRECKKNFPKWSRVCPVCSSEKSLEKQPMLPNAEKTERIAGPELEHLASGFPIFDRVFAGGFLRAFVYFIHASRGSGKTTFFLQICTFLVRLGKKVVFFSFDESLEGIRKKCLQYKLGQHLPHFVSENSPGVIERTLLEYRPDFVVVDSLQTLAEYNRDAVVGTLFRLSKEAKNKDSLLP